MGKILRDMTAEEQTLYDKESKTFPWLKTIKMSDDEFFECLERDMGKGTTALLFGDLFNKHYSWVFLAVLKHFYETGEFVQYDWNYIDAQTEGIIQEIMDAWGAERQTEMDVLIRNTKFDFSKHKEPTNVEPEDIRHYESIGMDYIFKNYYESHGFKYPF